MTRYFLIIDAGGESYVRWEKGGVPPTDPAYPEPVELDRFPERFERWDREAGCFVRDDEAAIDEQHGSPAIAMAHARKAIEADLILSGIAIPSGLLAAEADATGQNLIELAQTVAEKSAVAAAAELSRIIAKREARTPAIGQSQEKKNG